MPNQHTPPMPLADRLWPRLLHEDVERAIGLGPCWIWTRDVRKHSGRGYLTIRRQGKRKDLQVHRVAYALIYGPIPDGLNVCHHCDVPLCCRPDHLFLGTQADNIADMMAKGRGPTGDRHKSRTKPESLSRADQNGSRTHPERLPRGENHKCSKLKTADVIEIRRRYADHSSSQRALARAYGVNQSVISDIVTRKKWTHI